MPTVDAGELAAETDRAMERCHHRRVILEQGGDATAAALAGHGYVRSTHIVFAHRARTGPARRHLDGAGGGVRPARRRSRIATTIAEPWGDDEIAGQLNDAKRLVMRAVADALLRGDRGRPRCRVLRDPQRRPDGADRGRRSGERVPRPWARPSDRPARARRSTPRRTTWSSSRRSPTTGRASSTPSSASTPSAGETS